MARCSPASPGWRAYLLPRPPALTTTVLTAFTLTAATSPISNSSYKPARRACCLEETANWTGLSGISRLIYGEVNGAGAS
jgi:hypothetical protein